MEYTIDNSVREAVVSKINSTDTNGNVNMQPYIDWSEDIDNKIINALASVQAENEEQLIQEEILNKRKKYKMLTWTGTAVIVLFNGKLIEAITSLGYISRLLKCRLSC